MRKVALVLGFVLISFLLNSAVSSAPYRPGDVFIAYGGDDVSERGADGSPYQTLTVSPSSFTTDVLLSGGGYLALDESNNLYVVVSNVDGTGNYGIIKFDSSGNKVLTINTGTTTAHHGIAVRGGIIYVASPSNIKRFDATTGESLTGFGGGLAYRDVAFDSAGNLYGLRETEVKKWSAGSFTGSGTQVIGPELLGSDPRSIAFDNGDNLYVTSNPSGGRVIQKFPKSDGSFGTPSDISTRLTSGKLIGLAYDPPIDTFYASHTVTSQEQIIKFTPSDTSATAVPNTSGITGARDVAVHPTPEPSTFILLGAGAAFAYFMKRRRRRK